MISEFDSRREGYHPLSADQIGETGVVLDAALKRRDEFKRLFSDLADKIVGIATYASGN